MHHLRLLLIVFIGILVYSNTFTVPFQYDDTSGIVQNYSLRDLRVLWPPKGLRWGGRITFALNFYFGGLNVTGYHIVNLAIHIINAILVYLLVILSFKTPAIQSSISRLRVQEYSGRLIALSSGLLFVSHPVQTQAVTYIIQRFTSLATLFYLLSLVMYIKARLSMTLKTEVKAKYKYLPALTFYSFSFISAILAMNTKEISFTLPFIIVLYEFYFFSRFKVAGLHTRNTKRLLMLIPFLLTLFIIPLLYMRDERLFGDIIDKLSGLSQEADAISIGIYLLTQFRVIVTYIRLLFMPVNQNLDYDYPLSSSFLEPQTFLSFLFLLFLFAFAIYLFWHARRTVKGYLLLISFGILWFFITLSVESSIIPIRDVIFEHRLYLPGAGAIIAFISTFFIFLNYIKEKFSINASFPLLFFILLFIIIIPLSIATYKRNIIWKDKITLWEDASKKSPHKARTHNNLGDAYYRKGLTDKAIEHFNIATRLKPDYTDAHNNLGLAFKANGLTDNAIEHFQIALRLKPDLAEIHNNLGIAYSSKGLTDNAIEHFQIALRLKPDLAEAYNNLAVAYKSKGLTDKAIEYYKTALKLNRFFVKGYINLGLLYLENGDIDKAREEFEKALKIEPDNLLANQFLNSIYK